MRTQYKLPKLAGSVSLWRQRPTTTRELQVLSDHQLADIGMDRLQIAAQFGHIITTGGYQV